MSLEQLLTALDTQVAGGGPFEYAAVPAARLAEVTGIERHDVVLVLGSGWTPAADQLGEIVADVPVTELGGFAPSTVPGHESKVLDPVRRPTAARAPRPRAPVRGALSPATVVHPVRTAILGRLLHRRPHERRRWGEGGYRVGQSVLIADHLNLTGSSPLTGPNRG